MGIGGRHVLILGGTTEARKLATRLEAEGVRTLTSLAGVTSHPAKPAGELRIGGFGGVSGLKAFLERDRPAAICDATHPFSAQMSAHATQAAEALGLPLVRLERLPWLPQAGDDWQIYPDIGLAAKAIPRNAHVFLTIGRKEASAFFERPDASGVARMIEPPGDTPPDRWRIVLHRPPYSLADEIDLMRKENFTVLVTKNSGGDVMHAKLDAARELRCPVIMIARPIKPKAVTADSPESAAGHLLSILKA